MFSQNNILFYEPCIPRDDSINGSSGGSSGGICGSNKNYAGTQVFTDSQMKAIKHFQPFYEKSASKYNLPWELLAVLHYREHSLEKSNPTNGQGVYQLYSYTDGGKNGNAFLPAGAISDEEFQRQTDIVAKLISESYGKGKDLKTDDGVKHTLFSFNGVGDGVVFEEKAKALGFTDPAEGSAYVMNKYDEQRDPSSPNVNPKWIGNYTSDGNWSAGAKDERWGTFTAYKALTCTTGGDNDSDDTSTVTSSLSTTAPSCNSCNQGSLNINGAGACLAWPLGSSESDYSKKKGGSPTELLKESIVKLAGDEWQYYLDKPFCSGFTAAVVRWSGYDKSFPFHNDGGVGNAQIDKIENKDSWKIFDWSGDKSELQGGDIINCPDMSAGHSWMVIEDEEGNIYSADGSRSQSTFGHIREFEDLCYGGRSIVARATSANNSPVGVSVTGKVKASSSNGVIEKTKKGSGDIGASAIELAWPYSDFMGDKNYKKKPTKKFKKFYKTLSGRDGDSKAKDGKSCDYFVHTVLVYAGLEKNSALPWGNVSRIVKYVEASDNWQEIKMSDSRNLDEYQDGDLVVFYCSETNSRCDFNDGQSPGANHVAILVEVDGKKYTAQASYATYFGVVKGTGNITGSLGPSDANFDYTRVFRHKNNKKSSSSSSDNSNNNSNNSNNNECDLCGDEDNDGNDDTDDDDYVGGGTLKEGGYSSAEEAEKAVMSLYRKYKGNATSDFSAEMCTIGQNATQGDGKCEVPSQDNCTIFSLWFVKTFLGWPAKLGGMGYEVADNVYNAYHDKYPKITRSNNPTPYSIVSWNSAMPYPGGSTNHTGVVLGIKDGMAFVGEAAWSDHNHLGIFPLKVSELKGRGIYVDVSAYVKK